MTYRKSRVPHKLRKNTVEGCVFFSNRDYVPIKCEGDGVIVYLELHLCAAYSTFIIKIAVDRCKLKSIVYTSGQIESRLPSILDLNHNLMNYWLAERFYYLD